MNDRTTLGHAAWLAVALTVTLIVTLTAGNLASAETRYISDVLTVPLRSGPSNANRILHRGLPSGTALEILDRDDDTKFVKIRTSRGTEGWLPEQYLVNQPIARDRLREANQQIQKLNGTVAELRSRLGVIEAERGQAQTSSTEFSRRAKSLETELAEIKRISANAIAADRNNQRLTELNARLRNEVDELLTEQLALKDNMQQRWLLIGAGLVLLGLLLGVVIKARPRRSAWN